MAFIVVAEKVEEMRLCFGGRGCFAGGNQVFTDCRFGDGAI